MSKQGSVLFVGVGGQGTILASTLLSRALIDMGLDVKMSEVHGMAQRGGSVSTQVRYGPKVHSPLIEEGTCDVIVSFEKSESGRWISFLKKDGHILANNYEIRPYSVNVGKEKYPEDILEELMAKNPNTVIVEAHKTAVELGNPKVSNMVLLGALVNILELERKDLEATIRRLFPEKLVDVNLAAFEKGWNSVA